MAIYGGCDGNVALDDLFVLDCVNFVWWEVAVKQGLARLYGALWTHSTRLYFFGGRMELEVSTEDY